MGKKGTHLEQNFLQKHEMWTKLLENLGRGGGGSIMQHKSRCPHKMHSRNRQIIDEIDCQQGAGDAVPR